MHTNFLLRELASGVHVRKDDPCSEVISLQERILFVERRTRPKFEMTAAKIFERRKDDRRQLSRKLVPGKTDQLRRPYLSTRLR